MQIRNCADTCAEYAHSQGVLAFSRHICHALTMEMIKSKHERGTLFIAVATLVIAGAALCFSTWRMLRQEKDSSLEHLGLAARSVLQAVESSLRRGPGPMGRGMGQSGSPWRSAQGTVEFFNDLQSDGDLLFVGFIDSSGVFTDPAHLQQRHERILLPGEAKEAMSKFNRWHGVALFGGQSVYIAARKATSQRIRDGQRHYHPPAEQNKHVPHGNTPSSSAQRQENLEATTEEQPYLAIGLDMEKHLSVYTAFRNTALLQLAYVLGATALMWILALRFLSRRELAGRAVYLERLQNRLVDALPDGLVIADAHGYIQAINPAATSIFSGEADIWAGKTLREFFSMLALPWPPQRNTPENSWRQIIYRQYSLELLSLSFVVEHDRHALMVIIRDRTRIRALERSLADAEKLAAVGALAAGVAHEIRNPLSSLRGFAQYFAKKFAGKAPESAYADTMVRESDRLNRVITDLLYLSREPHLDIADIPLTPLLDELESLLRFDLEQHGLVLGRDISAPSIRADRDSAKQALLNLLLNSLDTLTESVPGAFSFGVRSWAGEKGVWLAVEDTGPGMNEAQKKQALEPFFTTKSKGAGLGLALVHKTMREHGGEVRVDSASGKGCAVRLFFPGVAPHEDDTRH